METSPPIQPSIQPPPIPVGTPWHFWPTIGFSLAVILGGLFAQMMVVAVATVVMLGMRLRPDPEQMGQNGIILGFATCTSTPIAVGLVVFFAWLRKGIRVKDYLLLRGATRQQAARWIVALFVLIAVSDSLTAFLGKPIVPDAMVNAYSTAGAAMPILWLAVIIAAPFGEEFLFRGFLFAGLQQSRLGTVGAAVITSGLWAGIHSQYDLYGILTVFVSGLFLSIVRQKTQSLWLCITLHSVMNLVATLEAVAYLEFFR